MRSRLLVSTLAAVAVAVVLLGVPLAIAFQYVARQEAVAEIEQQAQRIQATYENWRDPAVRAEFEQQVDADDLRVLIYERLPGGLALVADTDAGEPLPDFREDLVTAARRGRPASHAADGTLAVTIPVDGEPWLVRTLQDEQALQEQVRIARFYIGMLALGSLVAGLGVALWQGKRFAAPVEDLAASARRLGDGDFSARAPRTGLPEPDEVAAALDTTAGRLAAMLERSRSFNADSSHQLRTPLTALRLDLEALEQAGADRALVEAAIAEADRLEATIDELLALAETPRGDERLDIVRLVADRVSAWRSLARKQGRDVIVQADPVPLVRARAAALGQGLQVLLDNALEHGSGMITVRIGQAAGAVRLCVEDEGPGIAAERVPFLFDGSATNGDGGRGLPLARSLVEAEGGRISLERAQPGASVCLLLPMA